MAVDFDAWSRTRSLLTRQISVKFETKSSRFRLAMTCGFLIAVVGFLTVGSDAKISIADTVWGGMVFRDGGGGGAAPQIARGPQEPSPQYAAPRHPTRSAKHKDRTRIAKRNRDDQPDLVVHAAKYSADAHSGGGGSMCVRLCDGFVFPVGDYHGSGDRAAHEATCQSQCPGAKTALFVRPRGSDSIADATQVGSGRSYSELPDAFHYTTYFDASCSCHPEGGNRIKSLLRDFTLRRGDAVMTRAGLQVFHGGKSYPYKRRDFVALSKSRDIRKGDRAGLRAIERASLTVIPSIVASTPPKPVAATAPPTASLQHQAANN